MSSDTAAPVWSISEATGKKYRNWHFIIDIPINQIDMQGHHHEPRMGNDRSPATFSVNWFETEGGEFDVMVSHINLVFNCQICDAYPGFFPTKAFIDIIHYYDNPPEKSERYRGQSLPPGATAKMLVAKTECEHPNGEGLNYTNIVEFPTGRVVVNDDLRPVFDESIDDIKHSYNSVMGVLEYDALLASVNVAHAFVGNTCPDVVKTAPGEYAIVCQVEEDEEGGLVGETLAGVCTDLWASQLVDWKFWEQRCVERGLDPEKAFKDLGSYASIISIEPGRYRVTNDPTAYDGDELPLIMSRMKLIDE